MNATSRRRSTAGTALARRLFILAAVCACRAPVSLDPAGLHESPVTPLPAATAVSQTALLAARDRGDVPAMRGHGWALWQGLQGRWQGFERSDVVLGQRDRIFRGLRPFRIGDAIEAETLPVMFTVAFDPVAAAHIRRNALASRARLAAMAEVPAFPRGAIALKLVWYPVHRDRVTQVPIWDGDAASADLESHPDRTWRRTITIDPRVTGGAGPAHALGELLHHELRGDAELAAARQVAHDPALAAGDFVVLLAMHVTTKEIPDWVWATFWWHDRPDEGARAADRPAALAGAARHYLMDVAYSADTPREADGSPHVSMNPWLEARFPDGLHSNCLTCHQRAAYGAASYLPVTRGALAPDDPYFAGKTTTDFLWTLALEAH